MLWELSDTKEEFYVQEIFGIILEGLFKEIVTLIACSEMT